MRWRFSRALVRSHSVPACGDGAFLPLRDGQSPAFGDRHSSFLDDAGIRFLE